MSALLVLIGFFSLVFGGALFLRRFTSSGIVAWGGSFILTLCIVTVMLTVNQSREKRALVKAARDAGFSTVEQHRQAEASGFSTKADLDAAEVAKANEARKRKAADAEPFLNYRTVETKDLSFGTTRRIQVRISLPKHYAQDAVNQIAKKVVSKVTRDQPVNAISIFFYGPGTATDGIYDVAKVDWAPNGKWNEADSVKAGNYATFRYSVSYNPPADTPSKSSGLKASHMTGLLGVPLPEGARFAERTPADPASGRDPTERYLVSASAADIAAFFYREMPGAGWKKLGMSRNDALFFQRGDLTIGILINSSGGSFTLMGS